MRVWKAVRLATLALGAALAACGGGEPRGSGGTAAEDGEPVQGGTVSFGVLSDFQAFNPVTNTHLTSRDVETFMLFTPLIQYDAELNPVPWLAERWELSDTAVTFHLRDDVRWHDGQPVTAEDVKFTFDLAKNPETASLLGSAFINMVRSATVVDSQTIHFSFVAPHSQAMDGFWWSPLPKHLLGDVPPAQLARSGFNRNPVGSGPFKFVSWRPNQDLTFEANPDFPEALGGRPNLDRLIFRIIPEPTTMVTELLSGTTDVIGYTLLPDQARQIAQQGGDRAELRHYPYREFYYIGWNTTRPQFQDARVRRALAMALDRSGMVEALLHGYGELASGMIPPWSPLNPGVEPMPYDPAAAKQLLAEAGWTDRNGDGIVENEAGQPLRFTLLTNTGNQLRQDVVTVAQQQLREIGVGIEVRTQEFQSMLAQHKARNYDAILTAWVLDTFKVDPTPLFTCEQARTPGSANRAGYCNPAVDRLIERGLRTTDPEAAKPIWADFTRQLQQDQPITFLFWMEDLSGVGPRLRNVEMDPRGKLVNVHEWWIPARLQRR